jgi:hypothetical protein
VSAGGGGIMQQCCAPMSMAPPSARAGGGGRARSGSGACGGHGGSHGGYGNAQLHSAGAFNTNARRSPPPEGHVSGMGGGGGGHGMGGAGVGGGHRSSSMGGISHGGLLSGLCSGSMGSVGGHSGSASGVGPMELDGLALPFSGPLEMFGGFDDMDGHGGAGQQQQGGHGGGGGGGGGAGGPTVKLESSEDAALAAGVQRHEMHPDASRSSSRQLENFERRKIETQNSERMARELEAQSAAHAMHMAQRQRCCRYAHATLSESPPPPPPAAPRHSTRVCPFAAVARTTTRATRAALLTRSLSSLPPSLPPLLFVC